MAISTFDELKAAVALWLERSDLTDRIPDFIALAEATMSRTLRTRGATGRSTSTATTEYLDLPTDFAEVDALRVNGTAIDAMSDDAMSGLGPQAGEPRHYAIVGSQLRFWPSPDVAVALSMTYYRRVPPLSGSNATNWVLDSHPDAYLYGTLLQSGPFLRDPEAMAMFQAGFDNAMSQILAERKRPAGRLRTEFPALMGTGGFNIVTGE